MMRVYPSVDSRTLEPPGAPSIMLQSAKREFDLICESEWFEDPFVQEMILDVDNTKWITGRVFESPVLGTISPRELSGGVKGLILAYKLREITGQIEGFSSAIFGDNCIPWLCKISFLQDFYIAFRHALGGDPGVELDYRQPVCAQTADSKDWATWNLKNWGEVIDYYISKDGIYN